MLTDRELWLVVEPIMTALSGLQVIDSPGNGESVPPLRDPTTQQRILQLLSQHIEQRKLQAVSQLLAQALHTANQQSAPSPMHPAPTTPRRRAATQPPASEPRRRGSGVDSSRTPSSNYSERFGELIDMHEAGVLNLQEREQEFIEDIANEKMRTLSAKQVEWADRILETYGR